MTFKLYTFKNKFIKKHYIIPNNFTGIAEHLDGTKYWYLNDKRHRIDGPAIEHLDGTKEWYFNGKQMSEEQHTLYVDILKLKGLL